MKTDLSTQLKEALDGQAKDNLFEMAGEDSAGVGEMAGEDSAGVGEMAGAGANISPESCVPSQCVRPSRLLLAKVQAGRNHQIVGKDLVQVGLRVSGRL